ncbi:TonB-dependent receptor [bacterium]|nr:TonB-dependent receptor [candidate division CSSED10-310 bacterium]
MLRCMVCGIWTLILLPCLYVKAAEPVPGGSFEYDEEQGGYRYDVVLVVREDKPVDLHAIDELPAFVTVIDIDELEAGHLSLPEVLSRSVGVTVKDFGGLGALSTVSVRGSSANQVVVLLDGVRLNTASDGGVNLANLPLGAIERIEVLRGADSAVYGDGAMGGVVNLISRKADKPGATFGATLTYGSMATLRAGLSAGFSSRRIACRFHGYYDRSEGDFPFTNDNGTMNDTDDDFEDVRRNNQVMSGGGSLWWRIPMPDNDWEISGSLDSRYSEKGVPGIVTFPSRHALQHDRRLTGAVTVTRRSLLKVADSLVMEVTARRLGLDFEDPRGEQTGVPVRTRQRTNALDGKLSYAWNLSRTRFSMALHGSGERLGDDQFDAPRRTSWAISARQELELVKDRLWATLLERHDHASEIGGRFSPKLGLRWAVNERFAIKGNAGAGFRSPSFNELYMNMGFYTGNPDLEPESTIGYDCGASLRLDPFDLELGIFQQDSENLIQYLLVSGYRFKPYNIGAVRSRGVELNASCRFSDSFSVTTAYTYLQAVDRTADRNQADRLIPGRPEHEAFLRAEFERKKWSVSGEWRYLDGNYLTRANTHKLPVRRTANFGLRYSVTNAVRIGLEVQNLTNDRIVDVLGFPLPPRSFFATIGWRE